MSFFNASCVHREVFISGAYVRCINKLKAGENMLCGMNKSKHFHWAGSVKELAVGINIRQLHRLTDHTSYIKTS